MIYFRCRYQYLSKLITFCVLLGFAAVCGCSESENQDRLALPTTETPPAISREMLAEVLAEVQKNMFAAEMEVAPQVDTAPMAPLQRPPTIAETMAELRLEFPGNILDEDFTKIREIVESETYVEFLKRTYPQENQFQNFDEFWELASVDTEAYLEFLNTYFKPPHAEPTAADVSVLHYMASHERHINVRLYHGEDVAWDTHFEMLSNDPVYSWIRQRFFLIDDGPDVILWIKVLVQFSVWTKKLQEEDRLKHFFLNTEFKQAFYGLPLKSLSALDIFSKILPMLKYSKNGWMEALAKSEMHIRLSLSGDLAISRVPIESRSKCSRT